jgi:hypothetical protein
MCLPSEAGKAIEILDLERVHMFELLLQTVWAKKPL